MASVRRPGMRMRTTVAFGATAFVVSAGIAIACYLVTRTTLVADRQTAAQRQAFVNARAVRTGLRSAPEAPAEALGRAQTSTDGAALLRDHGDWYSSVVGIAPDDVPRAVLAAADRGRAARQRVVRGGEPTVVVATPVSELDSLYVELVPMGDVESTLARLRRAAAVAAIVGGVLGALVGRTGSGRLLRPVRRVAGAARGIEEGALDRRLEADGDADLEPLVESFNAMVDALQDRIEREARFASDVTHELRSPLATMGAALAVARRRVDEPAAEEALDVLEAEVARFGGLIDELLEISRAESGVAELARERVIPAELARAVLETTGHAEVPLVAEGDEEAAVDLDKRRLGQALANLLANADNYAGGATALTVRTDAGNVTFVVDDGGPGIPAHERSYVFGRFARGSTASTKGTGLGLALVAEHVRLHGGTVSVGDAPGGGARFTIEIPRAW